MGKWGLGAPGSEGAPERQGFEHFFGYLCQRQAQNHYPDHLWRDGERVEIAGNSSRAERRDVRARSDDRTPRSTFIDDNRREPFFLYVAFTLPHLALQCPRIRSSHTPGAWTTRPIDGTRGYLPHPTPRAAYAAMVTRLDRDVGRIVERIDELGLGEDTLVLFISDNGPTYDRIGGSDSDFFASAGGLRGLKGSVYEGGMRVPLIARWRGRIAPASSSDHVAAFWDVVPTLLEVAQAPQVPALDGLSFAPTLLGRAGQDEHDHLYWELSTYSGQQALRLGKWKAVRRNLNRGADTIELFDLEQDRSETRDLAAQEPALVARARELFASARTDSEEFPLGPKPGSR